MECGNNNNVNGSGLLYDLAECPVCLEVRRDTHVFICANGHNVCAVCKARVAQCPQGGCAYSDPPTRNRTVEKLIADGQFKFACKYSSESVASGCASDLCSFRGLTAELAAHEANCHFRRITCPNADCRDLVMIKDVIAHLEERHRELVVAPEKDLGGRKSRVLLWKAANAERDKAWRTMALRHDHNWFLLHGERRDGRFYAWVTVVADAAKADAYRSRISIANEENEVRFVAPVFSIDCAKSSVWADERCVELSVRVIKSLLKKRGDPKKSSSSDAQRDNFILEVTYEIV